jgi:hypothetical protein
MANASDIAETIEPGSLEQGDRSQFEADAAVALEAQGPQGPGPGVVAPAPPQNAGVQSDPLDFLLSGKHSTDLPVTAGVPFGAGSSGEPVQDGNYPNTLEMDKLRALAELATSPVLRKQARDLLRRKYREARVS